MVDKQVVGLREEETEQRHRRLWPKVMVCRCNRHALRAATSEGADLDRRFGIHGRPRDVRRRVGLRVHPRHLVEDSVGFGDFFWGWLFATFVRV